MFFTVKLVTSTSAAVLPAKKKSLLAALSFLLLTAEERRLNVSKLHTFTLSVINVQLCQKLKAKMSRPTLNSHTKLRRVLS